VSHARPSLSTHTFSRGRAWCAVPEWDAITFGKSTRRDWVEARRWLHHIAGQWDEALGRLKESLER
jgi:hypothetical protein